MALCPAELDRRILTFAMLSFTQTAAKCGYMVCKHRRRLAIEEPDHRHRRLLRVHHERPCGYGAGSHFDEIAASHRAPRMSQDHVNRVKFCCRSIHQLSATFAVAPRVSTASTTRW